MKTGPPPGEKTIELALEHLVRRLAAMLMRAGRGAMRLECFLKCTEGGSLQVAVGLFRPTAWANHLVELLQVRFESLQLPGPVDSIRLTATSTAPLELRQQEMFSEGRARPMVGGPVSHLAGLIDRLSNRLGHARVMGVRLIPDAQPELACHYTPLVGNQGARRESSANEDSRTPLSSAAAVAAAHATGASAGRRAPCRACTHGRVGGLFSFAGRQERIVRRWGPSGSKPAGGAAGTMSAPWSAWPATITASRPPPAAAIGSSAACPPAPGFCTGCLIEALSTAGSTVLCPARLHTEYCVLGTEY